MRKEKRRGGPVLLAGLGGFALGAATVLFVVWVYGVRPAGPAGGEGVTPAAGALGSAPGPPRTASPRADGPRAPTPVAPPGAPTPEAPAPDAPSPPGGEAPAPPPLPAPRPAPGSDVDTLQRRQLLLPVQGIRREQLRESFAEGRAGHLHEAIDIMAERRSPVLAVEDGRLVKLFLSAQGGNTIYQFDPSETYAYYYAHLDSYADGLHEGAQLRRGQVIGFVGTSGNAPPNAPHLHFAIFRLTPDKHWWQGTAIDPFLVLRQ
jgi:murein DD-endopeptidase MepM/ murein hydrolase activator NlpD